MPPRFHHAAPRDVPHLLPPEAIDAIARVPGSDPLLVFVRRHPTIPKASIVAVAGEKESAEAMLEVVKVNGPVSPPAGCRTVVVLDVRKKPDLERPKAVVISYLPVGP